MSRETKQDLARRVGDEFRINQNQSDMFDEVAATIMGINLTDLRCLDIISRRAGLTAGELAAEAGLTTGAVTAVIDRLERAGYARRTPDERDRRRIHVECIDPDTNPLGAIWGPIIADWTEQMMSCTADELRFLLRFMSRGNEIGRRHLERIRAEAAGH